MTGGLLVTGGTGLVGSNVVSLARQRGISVDAPTREVLDLLDFSKVKSYLESSRPETVVHAAGVVGGIHANMAAPAQFLVQNWDISRNLLLAAAEIGIEQVINLGSSCMYPRDRVTPVREAEIFAGELEPTNEGYALAKISAARLCEYIRVESPGLNYKTLVPSNIYGPGDSFDPGNSHLVAAIIHKIHQAIKQGDQQVEIWGDGKARREFMFSSDLADCILRAVEKYESMPSLMNVGTGFDLEVNEYYLTVADIVEYSGEFLHDVEKPTGMARKLLDVSLATEWGWKAETGLEEGVRKTYDYYLEHIR